MMLEKGDGKRKTRGRAFDQGEFRKYWLAIFGTCFCALIILVALLAPINENMAFAAFTLAGNLAILIYQYYFRRKTPTDTESK